MKKLTFLLLASASTSASAEVSKRDLGTLVAAGISDAVILSYVKAHGPLVNLTPEDITELKKAGLTDSLLAALLSLPAPVDTPYPAVAPGTSEYSLPPDVYYEAFYPGYFTGFWYGCPWFGYPWFGPGWRCSRGRWVYMTHPASVVLNGNGRSRTAVRAATINGHGAPAGGGQSASGSGGHGGGGHR